MVNIKINSFILIIEDLRLIGIENERFIAMQEKLNQ